MELKQKGVGNDVIDEAASSLNTQENDEKLMEKLIQKKKNLPLEKLIPFLMRRGFRYDEIKKHLKS
jgi:SOS response regulatory protein OraA/RecX